MQRLEISGAVRPIYGSLRVKRLTNLMQQNLLFIISLLYASTCFEHYCAHHQEVKILLYTIWYRYTV